MVRMNVEHYKVIIQIRRLQAAHVMYSYDRHVYSPLSPSLSRITLDLGIEKLFET